MRNAGLQEAQAGIKIARRNVNNLRYADDTTLMAESEEELKSLPGESHGRRSLVGYSPWVTKSRTQLSDFTLEHINYPLML